MSCCQCRLLSTTSSYNARTVPPCQSRGYSTGVQCRRKWYQHSMLIEKVDIKSSACEQRDEHLPLSRLTFVNRQLKVAHPNGVLLHKEAIPNSITREFSPRDDFGRQFMPLHCRVVSPSALHSAAALLSRAPGHPTLRLV